MESIRASKYSYLQPPNPTHSPISPHSNIPSNIATEAELSREDVANTSPSHRNQTIQSYSLFPTNMTVDETQMPASTFSPVSRDSVPHTFTFPSSMFTSHKTTAQQDDGLESIYIARDFRPPPKIHVPSSNSRHVRNSSLVSSATVQIGLRISNVNSGSEPLPSTSNLRHNTPPNSSRLAKSRRPSNPALQIHTQDLRPPQLPLRSPLRPNPLNVISSLNNTAADNSSSLLRNGSIDKAEREKRMKTLPPVPRMQSSMSRMTRQSSEFIQVGLSPSVYSSSSSPRSVDASAADSTYESASPTRVGLPGRPRPSSSRNAHPGSPLKQARLMPLVDASESSRKSGSVWI